MKPDYDALTPAQKSKLTRLVNKLDEQRIAAWKIQWEAYKAKQSELSAVSSPIIQEMKKELTEAIAIHEQAIKDLRAKHDEDYWAIINEDREKAKPESDEYQKASSMAHQWYLKERDKVVGAFWKELGYTPEEKTQG